MKEFFHILPLLTFSRGFNLIAYGISVFISRIIKRPVVWNQPYGLSIENAAVCNFSCVECPLANGHTQRTNSFMSCDTFQQTLAGIRKGTMYLNLYFQGEPLLDSKIDDRIKEAKKKKLFVSTSTNGSLLNKEMAKKLIDAKLDKIIISVDGSTAETYKQYRIGGDFDLLMKNIETLNRLKKEKKSKKPLIEAQMIVFKHNEHEIDDFKKLMKEKGVDIIRLKSAQFYSVQSAEKYMSSIPQFQRYKKDKNGKIILKTNVGKICKRLWHTILVSSDGTVPVCCYDKSIHHPMGNVLEKKLSEIWKDKPYMQFRKNYLKGKREDICTNCGG